MYYKYKTASWKRKKSSSMMGFFKSFDLSSNESKTFADNPVPLALHQSNNWFKVPCPCVTVHKLYQTCVGLPPRKLHQSGKLLQRHS